MKKKHPYGFANRNFEAGGEQEEEKQVGAEGENIAVNTQEGAGIFTQHSDEDYAALQKELGECRLRALAEIDNTRKRLAREKEDAVRFAASNVLADIVPALDSLDLALEHARKSEACKDFVIGVDLTRKMLLEALKKHDFEAVGNIGEPFDPVVHEAMSTAASPDVDNGQVCALLSKGYKLHDRLLRPAKVIVCRK